MKRENLTTKFGKENEKQYVLVHENEIEMYSYDTLIATIDITNQHITLTKSWDYSTTTLYYFKQFIERYAPIGIEYKSKKQFEKLIAKNENISIL